MVDEADKAPLEVVSVLRSLVEDEDMLLADGRRLTKSVNKSLDTGYEVLTPIHPGFKLWALANRRGFPFLGNDFFHEVGDVFFPLAIVSPNSLLLAHN